MQTTLARVGTILLTTMALAIAFQALRAGDPGDAAKRTAAEKNQSTTVADLKAKLKAGTFKLTEGEVVKLVGRPAGVKRPGENRSELTMHWEYATYIYATFKDGKLTGVTGAFSDNLPVERVNLANFKRLRIDMTEAEVIAVLGEGNGTVKVDRMTVRSWGRTARLWVSFNAKGLAFGEGLQEASTLSVPPGVQLPVPGTVKP